MSAITLPSGSNAGDSIRLVAADVINHLVHWS